MWGVCWSRPAVLTSNLGVVGDPHSAVGVVGGRSHFSSAPRAVPEENANISELTETNALTARCNQSLLIFPKLQLITQAQRREREEVLQVW